MPHSWMLNSRHHLAAVLLFNIFAAANKSFQFTSAAFLPVAGTAWFGISRFSGQICSARSVSYHFMVESKFDYDANDINTNINRKINPLEALDLPQPLILGSGSFTRKLILKEMGINFQVHVHPIDEKTLGDRTVMTPEDLVRLIAQAKADVLVERMLNGDVKIHGNSFSDINSTGYLILTGDQVVVSKNKVLEKPESIDEARAFVQMYAENPPSTVGACVITHVPSRVQVVGVERATIYFKPSIASSNLIDRLVDDDAPILSCAGGLMIEHPFVKEHVDNIDGTEDAVMGLSKDLVMTLLHEIKKALCGNSTPKGPP